MPPLESTVSTVEQEAPNVAEASAEAQRAEAMIFGDEPVKQEDGQTPESDVALDAGHLEEETPTAPSSETPTDEAGAKGTEAKPGTETTPTTDEAKAEAGAEDSDEKKQEEALQNELLGITVEPPTDPVWMNRYNELRSHATRLENATKDQQEYLSSQGLEIIQTKDGLRLAPVDGYKDQVSVDDLDVSSVYEKLSEVEKNLFDTDPAHACEAVARQVAFDMLAKRPPTNATQRDRVLGPEETDQIYQEFVQSKLTDGVTSRYPDATDPSVHETMQRLYSAPTPMMEKVRDAANKDPDIHQFMLQSLYNMVYRSRQAAKILLAERKAAAEKQTETNKKGLPVTAPGSASKVNGQQSQAGNVDPSANLLEFVMDSDKDEGPWL